MTAWTAVCFSRVQPVSFPLCRRLPTEHVSGHLQFKVEHTSTGPDGTSVCVLFLRMSSFQAPKYKRVLVAGASPDSIIGLSSLNGAPGTPSDDEDLPHHLPGVVSAGLSPTGSQGSSSLWEAGAMALPAKEFSLLGAEGKSIGPDGASGHKMLQRSLIDVLDAIEAPKGPGERPLGAAIPKLRSSFPTHTRLSAMLHIDSDSDEDRSGTLDFTPVPLSPLLMNGERLDISGADEEDPSPALKMKPVNLEASVLEEEPEGAAGGLEEVLPESAASLELGATLDLEDVLEQDVFSEMDEAPFAQALSHNSLPEEGEIQEPGRVPGEDPSSEIDSFSMATAPQTAFSSSESCPITLTTAVVSLFWLFYIN